MAKTGGGLSIRGQWDAFQKIPGGRFLFNKVLKWLVPYSGSIHPDVQELRDGYGRVLMKDRRSVRNHLQSVHAIALMNIGEMATGLAVMYSLPEGHRAIVTHLSMEYLKKARGPITCTCEFSPEILKTQNDKVVLHSTLTNAAGEVVAKAEAHWKIGLPPSRTAV